LKAQAKEVASQMRHTPREGRAPNAMNPGLVQIDDAPNDASAARGVSVRQSLRRRSDGAGGNSTEHRERHFGLRIQALVPESIRRGDATGDNSKGTSDGFGHRSQADAKKTSTHLCGQPDRRVDTLLQSLQTSLSASAERLEQSSAGVKTSGENAAMCGEIRGTSGFGQMGNDFHTRSSVLRQRRQG
jgi:hypothetical protein